MSPRCCICTRISTTTLALGAGFACGPGTALTAAASDTRPSVHEALLEPHARGTPEISTEQMEAILATGSAIVFDARPQEEYEIAHIPGSVNLDERRLGRFTQMYPDASAPMVVYSNGPFCELARSKSEALVRMGYTRVSRYQLGLPLWRLLGNAAETSVQGVRETFLARNAVLVDARPRAEYAAGTIPAAQSILAGEAKQAKQDRRLRYLDPNIRIVVFANSPREARSVATEISRNAYPNSSYFGGSYQDLKREKFFPERKPSPYFLDGLSR